MINLNKILINDEFSTLVDKLNTNFDQILLNNGGPQGPQGIVGSGIPGGPGVKGDQGLQGNDGATWTISSSNPSAAPSVYNKTLWLNYSNGSMFEWNGTTWINNGTFGQTSFLYQSGNIISNKNINHKLILSDEAGTPYNTATNLLGFLLKLNATSGNHLIFTEVDNDDSNGTIFTLDSSSFTINQQDSSKDLNIFSNKLIKFISPDIRFTSSNNNFHILSKVGISNSGTAFTPTETLNVGNPNGTDTGTLSIEKNSSLKFKGTGTPNIVEIKNDNSNLGGIQKLPSGNGTIASLKDFNVPSYSENWIEHEINNLWGWTPTSYAGNVYAFSNQLTTSSVCRPLILHPTKSQAATLLYAANASTTLDERVGFRNQATFKWKIIGNKIHLKWNLFVDFYFCGSSIANLDVERLGGWVIDLPFNNASNISLNGKSGLRVWDIGNTSVFGIPLSHTESHKGTVKSIKELTSSSNVIYSETDFTYQVIDNRDLTGSPTNVPYTGSSLYILHSNELLNYKNKITELNYSGECFLEIAPTLIDRVTWVGNQLKNLTSYFNAQNTGSRFSNNYTVNNGVPVGSIIFWLPDNVNNNIDQYWDASGLGIYGDVIGWAICDGRNGTPDLRGSIPVGSQIMSHTALPSSMLGTTEISVAGPYAEPATKLSQTPTDDLILGKDYRIDGSYLNPTATDGSGSGTVTTNTAYDVYVTPGVWIRKIM